MEIENEDFEEFMKEEFGCSFIDCTPKEGENEESTK